MKKITDENMNYALDLYLDAILEHSSEEDLKRMFIDLWEEFYDGIDSAALEHEIKHSGYSFVLDQL